MIKLISAKNIFVILLLIHGFIHLIGFFKAFLTTDVSKQVLGISKPAGTLWLLVFIMFIVSASSFYTQKKWFFIAFIAICLSQILIIMTWKDAKFGTILNCIILIVAISAYGNYRFNSMLEKESKVILNTIHNSKKNISENDIVHLPGIIQKWLKSSGVIGFDDMTLITLKQKGRMRTKPKSKWMSFEAKQIFNTTNPSFIWSAKVKVIPALYMVGRDKFTDGHGEMIIKLASLIPVVKERNNDKINQGTMIRFLSEMCWFPSAVLNEHIAWKAIDSASAEATFTFHNTSVSGVFSFTENGELKSFEALRYYGGNKDATLEKWLVETLSFKTFNGIKIPNKSKVTWKLTEGDFHWLTVEILDVAYNSKLL